MNIYKNLIYVLVILSFFFEKENHAQEKNIINYFANNNQIIGVPFIDKSNEFRFYPDVSLQEAISGVKVYYYILNDVYQSNLTKKENGLYWDCLLDRKFELGESIQRVEIIAEFDKFKLNSILQDYDIKTEPEDLYNYLLLRRGDDKALFSKSIYQNQIEIIERLKSIKNNLENSEQNFKNFSETLSVVSTNLGTKIYALSNSIIQQQNTIDSISNNIIKYSTNDLVDTLSNLEKIKIKNILSSEKVTIEDIFSANYSFSEKDKILIDTIGIQNLNNLFSDVLVKSDSNFNLAYNKLKILLSDTLSNLPEIKDEMLKNDILNFVIDDSTSIKFTELFKDKNELEVVDSEKLNRIVDLLKNKKNYSDSTKFDKFLEQLDSSYTQSENIYNKISSEFPIFYNRLKSFSNIGKLVSDKIQNQDKLLSKIDKISFQSKNDVIQPSVNNNEFYKDYVENRASSLLDIKYKPLDRNKIIFTYRNDKRSLQYLQASDPKEEMGIFRVRFVPFAIYGESNNPNIKLRTDRVVFEFAFNFGYGVIKDDNFKPVLFDLNRLGLAIGVSADTFGEKQLDENGNVTKTKFLSIGLSYDVNTYSSITFGINVYDAVNFYMGVGINKRAFEDMIKVAGGLF